jgi:hypothetical protein
MPETVTIIVSEGYKNAAEFLRDCKFETPKECDCGAVTEGKWAGIHHSNCPALLSPDENELIERALARHKSAVPGTVYESAVKGRSDFRDAYREAREETKQLRAFVAWIDTWVSNPVGGYAYPALAGLFSEARERIAVLKNPDEKSP